ncbi:hypothetical protein CBU02nite_23280 [Clostridium butyricum]|uniref:Arabinogalactan endo-beta-1,4-galactanase n=1 Tax=Clostridium butyricum TaxID=1492 RepID=A0A512TNH9_CLOBU|nr:hypothetical protein CBU02nite_23280 [Clostridium butyricum]
MIKNLKSIFSLVLCVILMLTISLFPTKKVQAATSFAKGADVGWLPQMEEDGFIFKNDEGKEEDCLQILKDHGIDSIRLRTWVNPSDDSHAGHCSTDETVAMAVRAKDMGFRIMIDFHYSDSWADPGKQVIPEAWKDDDLEQLKTHVYDYTKDVMTKLKDAGVIPEWVQVGNEINPGMLLPIGNITNPSNLAQLINNGYDAVKEVSPTTKVILHRANGYKNSEFRSFFDKLKANNAKYDVIGVSYYPEGVYTDTIDDLGNNLNDMASRYDKEVMVVEVGSDCSIDEVNAHNMLVAVQKKVSEVPNGKGIGVFYWEPEGAKSWSGYSMSAWNGYDGNDNDGQPTKAMDAFLPGEVELNLNPVIGISLDKEEATVEVGSTVTINATLTPSDSTYKGVIFSSSDESIAKINTSNGIVIGMAPGVVTITATSYDQHITATCQITVIQSRNLIKNSSFELDKENWNVAGDTNSVTFENDSYKGDKALHYYNGDFEASQIITGLENGFYKLSAWASGGGEEKLSEIFAVNENGQRYSEPFINTGWDVWNKFIVNNIEVTDGKVTIGANVKMNDAGGQWGNIDEFELIQISTEINKSPIINSIVTTPESVTLAPGETKKLTAKVDGENGADETVIWSSSDESNKVTVDKNGLVSVEEDATLGDYEIKAVSTVDKSKFGITKIKVVNDPDNSGKDNSESDKKQLTITKQPDDLTLNEGQIARFNIEVTGKAPFNYQWQKNCKDLEDDKNLYGANEATLTIENVTTSDSGVYICKVTDYIGNETTSSAVRLSVNSDSSSTDNNNSNVSSSSSHRHHHSSNSSSNESSNNNGEKTNLNQGSSITSEDANIITALGEGTQAEKAKEFVASNGNKLFITPIYKNGKSMGTIIKSEGLSLATTIYMDKKVSEDVGIYKYVPSLNKYIKLSEGVVIENNTITLPTQANTTYLASTAEMLSRETIKQGWNKVNNNWYMVNGTGDLQVGWQKDNVGWAYLSPTNGVMQTNWLLDVGKWYYLKDNGYMATGWIKDGYTWYYCNADGSMAANTTIDGYHIGSNGAWIE